MGIDQLIFILNMSWYHSLLESRAVWIVPRKSYPFKTPTSSFHKTIYPIACFQRPTWSMWIKKHVWFILVTYNNESRQVTVAQLAFFIKHTPYKNHCTVHNLNVLNEAKMLLHTCLIRHTANTWGSWCHIHKSRSSRSRFKSWANSEIHFDFHCGMR